jgi:hypothetical protein
MSLTRAASASGRSYWAFGGIPTPTLHRFRQMLHLLIVRRFVQQSSAVNNSRGWRMVDQQPWMNHLFRKQLGNRCVNFRTRQVKSSAARTPENPAFPRRQDACFVCLIARRVRRLSDSGLHDDVPLSSNSAASSRRMRLLHGGFPAQHMQKLVPSADLGHHFPVIFA